MRWILRVTFVVKLYLDAETLPEIKLPETVAQGSMHTGTYLL